MTERIEATGLVASAGGTRILDDVSVQIRSGEVLGLIGANGAGKTTLLRALLRLGPIDGGRITLNGRDISAAPPHRVARDIAYLPQDRAVYWPLRVDRLVALGRLPHGAARPFGAPPDPTHPAVERAMARTDVTHLRHRQADTLSGGERARVLLARALAAEAPALLADEPGAGLDPYHQLAVMEMFRDAAADGTAVALVVHDLSLAARFCGRLVLLSDGRVLAAGAPHAVLSDANLARAYGIRAARGEHGTLTPIERVEAIR